MTAQQLNFSIAEYQSRIAKTRTAMQAKHIDVLIVTDPSNMAWLTGYDGWFLLRAPVCGFWVLRVSRSGLAADRMRRVHCERCFMADDNGRWLSRSLRAIN